MAWPRGSAADTSGGGSPAAIRSWSRTRSRPVMASVTGCSTWMRALTSRNQNSSLEEELDRAGADVVDGRATARAASPSRRRRAGPTAGDGASSTSFWWRRWTEHSRSNSWAMRPPASARSWTSTCRGASSQRSRNTSSLPKAASAWRRAASTAAGRSPGSRTTRMPMPPPPWTALTSSGNPTRSPAAAAPRRPRRARPREHRHPGPGGGPLGLQLVAEGGQHLRWRPHEQQAPLAAAGGELGPLGQEPVAGVDGVGPVASAASRMASARGRSRPVPPAQRHGLVGQGHEGASRSGSENTATVAMPMDRAVRSTRAAISPRLATSSLAITSGTPRSRPCPSPPPSGRPTGRCRARCGCRAGR